MAHGRVWLSPRAHHRHRRTMEVPGSANDVQRRVKGSEAAVRQKAQAVGLTERREDDAGAGGSEGFWQTVRRCAWM